jgi:hypothetical protein
MSSEVETFLITSFSQASRDLIRSLPVRSASGLPVYVAASQPLHSATSLRSARNDNYPISAAALASLRQDYQGFPGENARAVGKRRHSLHSNAFADR